MTERRHIPLRLKMMVALLIIVTAVVSVISFTMARMFHDDKRLYATDVVALMAVGVAEESRTELARYEQSLRSSARVARRADLPGDAKSSLLGGYFTDCPELIAVHVVEEGREVAAVHDPARLEENAMSPDDLAAAREAAAASAESIAGGTPFVRNLSRPGSRGFFALAIAAPEESGRPAGLVVGVFALDGLQRIATRSESVEVQIVDGAGILLATKDRDAIVRRHSARLDPETRALAVGTRAAVTNEREIGGSRFIEAAAGVGVGELSAFATVPGAAAYLASRSLMVRLVYVALFLLLGVAAVGVAWASRVTSPVERLADATREVARGRFDAKVEVGSNDEIGTLARSFNAMTGELASREARLRDAQAQLVQSEKMAAFGLLGAGIAHEVKNPLAGILGCAQISVRKAEPGTVIHDNLQLIEKETKRCKTIIENLLKFARQEKAAVDEIDVNDPVADACSIVRHQLELQQVRLEQDLGRDLPKIKGNANQLQQVFLNLMINAQQAMGSDGGTVFVSTARRPSGEVEIRFRDTGPGIPPEIRGRIFDPFFTTKPNGKGTGLGLSVSFGIVRDHGGEISVTGDPGQGATFVIVLPAAVSVSPVAAA